MNMSPVNYVIIGLFNGLAWITSFKMADDVVKYIWYEAFWFYNRNIPENQMVIIPYVARSSAPIVSIMQDNQARVF